MAVSLGKRKRRNHEDDAEESGEDEVPLRALFQRAFQAKFKPLDRGKSDAEHLEIDVPKSGEGEEDEDDDWSGLSEDEDVVETIHTDPTSNNDLGSQNAERKAFMSSKPPITKAEDRSRAIQLAEPSDVDSKEATNLKHDLALQRLLKESHLLESNSFKPASPTMDSKSRLKALDLRLKNLGAKDAISEQQKMPLSHRRGIAAKATDREKKRRKHAVENGVVLEKARHAKKVEGRRVRSVGAPGLGKFRGGTLKLSGRDVRAIQGPQHRSRR